LSTLIFSAVAACALAQTKPEFQPEVGQQGKDVVWVPSPQELVDKNARHGQVTPRMSSWISARATSSCGEGTHTTVLALLPDLGLEFGLGLRERGTRRPRKK